MIETTKAKPWVPLRDYLVDGVRPPKQAPVDATAGSLPPSWVSAWDYWVEGVRKPRPIVEESAVISLKPARPKKPVPPEAWLTVDDVIADIQAVFARSIVPLRVEDMQAINQQELERAEIVDEEWQYRSGRLEEIQEEHFVRIEEIVQWYVDNYFREWDATERAAAH